MSNSEFTIFLANAPEYQPYRPPRFHDQSVNGTTYSSEGFLAYLRQLGVDDVD